MDVPHALVLAFLVSSLILFSVEIVSKARAQTPQNINNVALIGASSSVAVRYQALSSPAGSNFSVLFLAIGAAAFNAIRASRMPCHTHLLSQLLASPPVVAQ